MQAVKDPTKLNVEVTGRLMALIHETMRRLAATHDAADRAKASADFSRQVATLRREVQEQHGLDENEAETAISHALSLADRLLHAQLKPGRSFEDLGHGGYA